MGKGKKRNVLLDGIGFEELKKEIELKGMREMRESVEATIIKHIFEKFEKDLCKLINKHGIDNYCEMPDWIIAHNLIKILNKDDQKELYTEFNLNE